MSTNQKAKPRLGRGLSSLISMSDLPVEAEVIGILPASPTAPPAHPQPAPTPVAQSSEQNELPPAQQPSTEIAVDAIAPNPHQPRRQFDQAAIQSLAASIKSTGLVQPIVVRHLKQVGADGTAYQLVAGERRWRAAKAAGLLAIPAIIRDVDAFTQAQMALVENIQREDLNPMDRAQAYRALMDQLGLTQAEMASRIGEDRSSVANYLRLLDLAPAVRELIRQGRLSLGHAKVLAGIADADRQEELAKRTVEQDLSVRNLERVLQTPEAPVAPPRKSTDSSAHLKDLERSMTSQLGMRVQVRASGQKGKGKLVIHYTNLDQFDQLMDRLGLKTE